MIWPLLLVPAARAAPVVEAWVSASPEAIQAAGASFAEGTDGDRVRVVGSPAAIAALGGVPTAAATGGYAPSPEAVEAQLVALAAGSGGRAEVVDVGTSLEGRPIVGLHIGVGRRALRVLGGHHGDEGSSVVVALALADALVADPSLLPADTELWLVPVVNPDGLAAGTRHNAANVDLNRNYGWEWSAETPYGGPSPFSEPETRAVRALSRARSFVGGVSLHSGATNLGWVWNWTTQERAVDEPLLGELAGRYAEACTVPDFWITNGADWYLTRGDTTDWTYGRWGTLDYTLELTNEKSPPEDLVATYVGDHLPALLALLAEPVGFSVQVTDAETGEPLPARLSGPDLAPQWSGPDGSLARWYAGDPAALTVSAPGYAEAPLSAPALTPLGADGTRPEPALLSRADGPTRVAIPGFGDGPLTLSQPGEADVVVPAAEDGAWIVDPATLPSGAWTLTGDAGVLPRALFVGEVTDRVVLEAVEVEGGQVTLFGRGFGRGSEAWALGGDTRAPAPLERVAEGPNSLVFRWSTGADDLLLWSGGAWLAAVDVAGEPRFDHTPPTDTGAPEVVGSFDEGPARRGCDASAAGISFANTIGATLVFAGMTRRRKRFK